MKKLFLFAMALMLSVSVMAQQSIKLRSVDKAECVKSDMTSLRASFSFSTIEAQDYESERGTFSWLSLPNTVIGGNEGDPQIPVVNQLVAVPFGANPRIEITSYSTTDYRLADYDMKTLVPRQLPVRKDQKPEDLPFIMNEAAYQSTRGLSSAPTATIDVVGTMRGVRLGKLGIEPVSYDPVNNTIRVFNDIEVTVHFDDADAAATEQMLVDTYSPYFDIVYKSLFNGRAVTDAYSDHPDLYQTPVKMLVVTTSTFTSSTAFQNWLTWKKQKGIEVDVQEVTSSTSSASVRTLIQNRYNANHPTFLVIVGDESVVKNYTTWTQSSLNYSPYISDNAYASIDSDVYHDMYMSRMAVANTTQLGYLVNKILMYEKYTMSDPSYLNHTLLIAGWDSNWTAIAGKPTINYAANNYFNTAHGITPHTYITTASGQTTCYNYMNQVGFINYTAHGDIQEWADPEYTNTNVNNLTNTGKPFWAMGNCCLTANWGNSSYSPCFGEAMIRANNKGAFGYIGSIPESYWYEDLYFGVGAFAAQYSSSNSPTVSGTTVGAYDAMFDETGFNCLNAVPYIGNVAVTYAHAKNYNSSVSDEYYWRGYQCLGDGSVMPYVKVPAANTVSHDSQLLLGATSFTVNADAGSYVSITVNNEIIGVAAVPANATSVDVTIAPQTSEGSAMIVVTRNQRQPYITTIPIMGSTEYAISTNVSPANAGTVTGAGTYYENTQCTLTAEASHGYTFANWTLNNTVVSTDPTYTFTVTGDATYVANFTALTEHHFTYNPQQEHGTISVSPTSAYMGDIITLTATPEAGYRLDQWDVNTVSKGNVQVVDNQFTMPDSDVTISATFRSGYAVTIPYLVGGTITASAGAAQPGETITLTVTPNSGYEFISWNVYETGNTSNTVTVTNNSFTMPEFDVTVSAVFGTSQVVDNEVTVGTGTNGNGYLPVSSSRKYSLSEQIYTASELGSAGTITGVDLYFASSSSVTRNLVVYMVSTTKNTFGSTTDWINPTSANIVYSGNVTFTASSWNTITFTTPFAYDGTNNVALIVDDNSTSTATTSFYVTSTTDYQAIYLRPGTTNNTNYSPETITTAGSRTRNKNSAKFHIRQQQVVPLVCEAVPTNVTVSNVTPEGATISWSGDADSYNIRYRTSSAFVYDFESAEPWVVDDFAPCTTYDGDGSTTYSIQNVTFTNQGYTGSFIAFQNGTVSSLEAHSGNAFGACFAATTPTNNDFFILPEMTIQSGDIFSFWAMQYTDNYPEAFKVGVYNGNGGLSSYLAGSASTSITPTTEWEQYSYDLSAYAGQTIQLAIQCVSDDAFIFCIDDIYVGNANGGSWDVTITDVTSPYTLTGLSDETIYDVQVVGVCDGIGESEGVGSNFTTLSWCAVPTDLGYYETSATTATIGWTGYQESYNIQYRTAGGREEYLYTGFESGLPSGWTEVNNGSSTGIYSGAPNSGTYMYGFVRNGTNIQYLITPELGDLEAGSIFAFYHLAYNANATIYIGYSSTTNSTSAFTWGSAQTVTSSTAYDLYYEEIPTGTKYIAIRVSPVTTNAYYFIDDVMVVGPYVEPGEWHYVNNITGLSTTLTDLDPETEYEWQVEGVNCDGNGGTTGMSSESYFITGSLCDAPAGLSTTDITYNSATLNWAQDLDEYNVRYAPVSYFEGFEEGLDDWTVITNGDYISEYFDEGWIDFAPSEIWSNLDAHSGYGTAMAFSYNPFGDEGVALTVDNWLISPQVDLQGYLKFWVMTNYDDPYEVLLSTTGNEESDFTVTLLEPTTATYREWTEVSIDLSAYAGQQGYIAIHHEHTDGYVLFIDDFGIYTEDWNNYSVNSGSFDAEDLDPLTDYVWQVQGVDCDGNGNEGEWSSIENFTTLFGMTLDIAPYTAKGGYYLIASPVVSVNPTEVTNMTSNTYDLYAFDQEGDEEGNEWINYKPDNFDLEAGQGYLYANSGDGSNNDVTLVFTGEPYDGDGTFDLIYSEANPSANMRGWNLVGNPFTEDAYIDLDYYVMNAEGTEIVAATYGDAINPMEGVFVVATGEDETVTFGFEAPNSKGSLLSINLSQGRGLVDRAIVRFGEGRTLPKFQISKNSTKVYIPMDGQDLAVVRTEGVGELPVNFKAESNGTYTLSFTTEEVSFGYLHLIDNVTGIDVDLLANPSYTFDAKTTDYANRFKLVFATGNADDNFAFFSNGSFVINNEGEATLQVIDVTGRILSNETINGCTNLNVNAASGVYMIRLVNGDNVKVQKVVVE